MRWWWWKPESKTNLEEDLFEKKCIFFINTVQLHFTMSFYFLDIKTLTFTKEFLYKYMKRDPSPLSTAPGMEQTHRQHGEPWDNLCQPQGEGFNPISPGFSCPEHSEFVWV